MCVCNCHTYVGQPVRAATWIHKARRVIRGRPAEETAEDMRSTLATLWPRVHFVLWLRVAGWVGWGDDHEVLHEFPHESMTHEIPHEFSHEALNFQNVKFCRAAEDPRKMCGRSAEDPPRKI